MSAKYGLQWEVDAAIKYGRDVEAVKASEETMTAGELAAYFASVPPDTPVMVYDDQEVKEIVRRNLETDPSPRWMFEPRKIIIIDVDCPRLRLYARDCMGMELEENQ